MYSTEIPGDPKSLYRDTGKAVRNLALDHMLAHRSVFEGSFGRKVPTLKMTDQTTTSGEINTMMEEDLATEMESESLDSALDPDLDGYITYCHFLIVEVTEVEGYPQGRISLLLVTWNYSYK
jgi:hypothetical protein